MLSDDTTSHANWADLVAQLIELQTRFVDSAESLAPEKRELGGVSGNWCPRELVAHISGWDTEVLRQFDLFKAGFTGEVEHNIDTFNQQSVTQRAGLSWRATIDEIREIHRLYPAVLDSVTESDRAANAQYREWLEVLIGHYRHHLAQLQDWKRQK